MTVHGQDLSQSQGHGQSQSQEEPHGPLKKTIVVLGPQGVGKATTIGNMIYKCGGIDLATMEVFQRQGIQTFGKVVPALRARNALPSFFTPKGEVVVLDEAGADALRADCALLIVAADAAVPSSLKELERWRTILGGVGEVIVLVNKMDKIAWNEDRFDTVVEDAMTHLKELGVHVNNVTAIPISGLHGDNLIEPSPNSPWYKARGEDGKALKTVLEATDSGRAPFR